MHTPLTYFFPTMQHTHIAHSNQSIPLPSRSHQLSQVPPVIVNPTRPSHPVALRAFLRRRCFAHQRSNQTSQRSAYCCPLSLPLSRCMSKANTRVFLSTLLASDHSDSCCQSTTRCTPPFSLSLHAHELFFCSSVRSSARRGSSPSSSS